MALSSDDDVLLAAHAVGALEGDELRRADELIATDPDARAEFDAYLTAATSLVPDGVASPGLWDRIQAQVAPDLASEPSVSEPSTSAQVYRAPFGMRRWVAALGAAAALATAFAIGSAVSQGEEISSINELAVAAAESDDFEHVDLVSPIAGVDATIHLSPDGLAYLINGRLPVLAEDRSYQLWGVTSDEVVVSLGVFGNSLDVATFQSDIRYELYALTDEVAGGVVASENELLSTGSPG